MYDKSQARLQALLHPTLSLDDDNDDGTNDDDTNINDHHSKDESHGGIKSKSRKRKRLKVKASHSEDRVVTPLRPGKRRLRKLRYQQRVLSPVQFAWVCAETVQDWVGTKSVVIVKASGNKDTDPSTTKSQTSSKLSNEEEGDAAKTIHIVTSVTMDLPLISTFATAIVVRPLLVLDLNGILCHRVRQTVDNDSSTRNYRPSLGWVAGTPIVPRPDLESILTYWDAHFCMAVWTSAKPKTATQLIQLLFPTDIANRLLFLWTQQQCESKVADGNEHVFEKNLQKVWTQYPLWNAHNTLLVDDSPEKCAVWNDNALHPPSLHGLERSQNYSDEENTQQQRRFFEGLVEHWKQHPLVHTLHGLDERDLSESTDKESFAVSKSLASFLCEAKNHLPYK